MDYFVHPNALCESPNVGAGTRVWAFAHILPGARLGQDCNICDNVFIENDVVVGDRVTIKCGVQLWDGAEIEGDVFIGPNVTFTNDLYPRSKQYPESFARTVIRTGASLGANATILPGITVGAHAMVGAGAVVTRSVPPNAIVIGNPARIVGYVDAEGRSTASSDMPEAKVTRVVKTTVKGVTLHTFRAISDLRGTLSFGEFEREIPFTPKRYFLVYGVPAHETRGAHAHRACHQFMIAVRGSVRVVADDGATREELVLDRPNVGLYLPPMVWGIQYRYSDDAVLFVFASDYYDADDYVNDYGEFVQLASARKRKAQGAEPLRDRSC